MGFRTVVVLNNDLSSTWGEDGELGHKIQNAMHYAHVADGKYMSDSRFRGGRVIECVHADTQSLVVVDAYDARVVGSMNRNRNDTQDVIALRLLRDAAARLGYQLVPSVSMHVERSFILDPDLTAPPN